MADYKEYDFNPYSLPSEMLEAIGLVTACHAQSELFLQDAIAGCAGLDFMYGRAITTHMAMPLRFDVLRSVAEIHIDDLDVLDELDGHLDRFDMAIKKRNAIAHNRWCRDPETGDLFTVKETARGSVQADLVQMTVEQVRADARLIYDVGLELFQFLRRHNLMPKIPDNARPRGHKNRTARKKRRKAMK
jgi:hypothetical protein